MARQLVLQNLMKLAKSIGANPSKYMGTKTNITFLGKGPTKNPLFQGPLNIESATEAQMGSREGVISAVEDAMGFASANKLNDIQLRALTLNLQGINKMFNPPVLPMASVTPIRSGIQTIAPKPMTDIERLLKHGYTDARGRRWDFPKTQGPGNLQGVLDQKTGMSRAIARQILQQDTRLKLKPEELFMLREGKGEPLELMRKYYGRSMMNLDDFLDNVNLQAGNPRDLATRVLSEVELIPQFAEGGLAGILEV